MQYQLVLQGLAIENPLQVILDTINKSHTSVFTRTLKQDQTFNEFMNTPSIEQDLEPQLCKFLHITQRDTIIKEAQNAKLTRIIPIESRKVPGLFLADISLATLSHTQQMLLSYRRNWLGAKKTYLCGKLFR
jgi:hypothetical protein